MSFTSNSSSSFFLSPSLTLYRHDEKKIFYTPHTNQNAKTSGQKWILKASREKCKLATASSASYLSPETLRARKD
jgi:hypothetical protein